MSPCLYQHVLDDSALTGGGEEDLIDKLLSGMLERFQRTDDIACGGRQPGIGTGKVEAGQKAETLLMQEAGEAPGGIKMQAPGQWVIRTFDNSSTRIEQDVILP